MGQPPGAGQGSITLVSVCYNTKYGSEEMKLGPITLVFVCYNTTCGSEKMKLGPISLVSVSYNTKYGSEEMKQELITLVSVCYSTTCGSEQMKLEPWNFALLFHLNFKTCILLLFSIILLIYCHNHFIMMLLYCIH